jgi:hypothetical protein
MAKKISARDLFTEEDVFKGIRKSAEETISTLEKVNAEFKKTASTLKSTIGQTKVDSNKSIKEFIQLTQQANKLAQESAKVEALRQKAIQQSTKAQQEQERLAQQKSKSAQQDIKLTRDQAREQERLAREQAKATKNAQDLASAYKQLEKNTRDLKNQSKELGAQLLQLEKAGRKNTDEYRKLEAQYRKVTASAQQGDAQLKKLDKTVGDNFRNVGNYQNAIGKLNGLLGSLGLAFGIGNVVQGATRSIMDFEQTNATLSAVLGTTADKTLALQEIQRDLGKTSGYTASQVGELQTELARLGFTEDELKSATQSVLLLAKASGSDLGRAAEVAGATLRGFGLDASETDRVANVMAKSFDATALGMENFAEAMKYVAPVAKSAGVSIEEATAMLGALSNAGIQGSQAGTSLRRILSDMAMTGKPVKQALDEVIGSGISLTDAFDEVGRSAQTSLLVLADNKDTIGTLTESLIHSEGAVQKTANTMSNTLGGSLGRLKGAFEGYILDLNESAGASGKLRDTIEFLTANMDTILNTVLQLVEVFIKWKAITMVTTLQNKLMASSFMEGAKGMGFMQTAMKGISAGFQQLGKMIKENIVGIALVAIFELYNQFKSLQAQYDRFSNATKEIAKQQKAVADNTALEAKEMKNLFDALKKSNPQSQERSNLITEINDKYGTTLTNLANEHAFVQQVDQAYADLMETLKAKTNMEGARVGFEISQKNLVETEAELERLKSVLIESGEFQKDFQIQGGPKYAPLWRKTVGQDNLSREVGGLIASVFGGTNIEALNREYNALIKVYDQSLKLKEKYEKEYLALQVENAKKGNPLKPLVGAQPVAGVTTGTSGSKTKKGVSEFEIELDGQNAYIQKQIELLQKIEELKQDEKFRQRMIVLDGAIGDVVAETQRLAEAGKDAFPDIVAGELYDAQERAIIELYDFLKSQSRQRTDFEISEIKRKYAEEQKLAKETLDKEYQDKVKQYEKDKKDIQDKIKEGTESSQSLVNLNKAKTKLDQDYADAQVKLAQDAINREVDMNSEIEIINLDFKNEELRIEDEQNAKIDEYNEKRNVAYEKGLETRATKRETDAKKEIEDEKDALAKKKAYWQTLDDMVKLSTDFFITQSEKRIAQIDKEIEKAQSHYDHLKALAENGNINAEQSLAEQQKIIDEANKKRMKEEKLQQRIKLAQSVYDTYSKKVQDPNTKNALADTIKDVTLLQTFINSLPAFEKGIEDTGTNGKGVDGRGGFHAILHPNERVIPKDLNQKIGDLSNTELAQIASNYRAKSLGDNATQMSSALELSLLVDKIDELKTVIQNKPEVDYQLGEVTQATMEIVRRRTQGNTVTYNRFKVK